jgi:hypothetical protein
VVKHENIIYKKDNM